MKNKILILIILILALIYTKMCFKEKNTFFLPEQKTELTIKLNNNGEISDIPLNQYIIGVVAAEMPASFEMEALKAQAIASRTYAMYKKNNNNNTDYDLVANINDQAYNTEEQMKTKWQNNYDFYYNKIKEAVIQTNDLVMKNNDSVICAYYFSLSNGKTENAISVFQEDKSYLKSVDSPWDTTNKNYEIIKEIKKTEFCELLNIDCNQIIISDINRNSTNHVDNLKVNNILFAGTTIRKLLNLRSTDFDIDINENIKITTRGYGHGVGMSQNGANEMAKQGYTYDQILKYYYQNINIENLNV